MLRQDDFRNSMVVLEAWRQGKDHGVQVCQMIAGCMANRERLGWGKWTAIIQSISKFSATLELPNRTAFPDLWEPNFIKLLHTVPGIIDGSAPDPACGGIYWADLAQPVTNDWFKKKVLGSSVIRIRANQNSFTVFG